MMKARFRSRREVEFTTIVHARAPTYIDSLEYQNENEK